MTRSADLLAEAMTLMPGGVSSPVRAFAAVGGSPPFISSAQGSCLVDADGAQLVDFVLAYGPHILGHGSPEVVAALRDQIGRGIAYGASTELELELARRVVDAVPSIEMVRFVNSGTEATMSALRLARAVTGRERVVKCAGGYHGHADLLLVEAGSGVMTLAIPGSPGVPSGAVRDTAVAPYNDIEAMGNVLAGPIPVAAVILEPVAGNMGCVPPRPDYLQAVRDLCSAHGALLIFDEVMTGFRVAYGGAQSLFGVIPDLTCLGKVIGGGLPVGAYGGRRDLMARMAPIGDVYQAGTLSGNPLAMAAGCAILDVLADGQPYARLERAGRRLTDALLDASRAEGIAVAVNRVGSMLTAFIGVETVSRLADARRADTAAFATLHRAWMDAGVFWPPSQFEAAFLCTAHTDADLDRAVAGFTAGLRHLRDPVGSPAA